MCKTFKRRRNSKTEEPIFKGGHPWFIVDDMVLKGENLLDMNWAENDRFSSSVINEHVKRVSDGAALSHLLSLAFPWVFQAIRLDFTSITIIDLENEKGTLTFPRLTLLNDARHLEGIDSEVFFGN